MSFIKVHAFELTPKTFSFHCPFCWSKYKKDGSPAKTARRLVHTHGSNGLLCDRRELRISQCDPYVFRGQFEITIDDLTSRT